MQSPEIPLTVAEAMQSSSARMLLQSGEEVLEDPAKSRRDLNNGLTVKLEVRLTQRMGWGVYTLQRIKKGEAGTTADD